MMAMRWKFFGIHNGRIWRFNSDHIANSYRQSSYAVASQNGIFFDGDLLGERRMFYVPTVDDVRQMFFLIIWREIKFARVFMSARKKDEKVVDCNNLLRESTSLLAGKPIEKRL